MPDDRPQPPRRWARDDRGAVAVIVALFMVVFMTLLAFVVDIGMMQTARAKLQNAVDSAALAAAWQLPAACSGTPAASGTSACVTAGSYAVANGVPLSSVTVTSTAGSSTIRVSASENVRLVFAPIIGQNSRTVTATAVATRSGGSGSGFAIYAGNQVNLNGGGSATAALTGSIFAGGSGGGRCANNCPMDIPNGVGKVVITSGDAYSPVTPAMKNNADFTADGVLKHASTLDTGTSTDPVTHATQTGLLPAINGHLATGTANMTTVAAPSSSGRCAIDLSNRTTYPSSTTVITCNGRATLTGSADARLKVITATGGFDIDTDVGSAGNVVILSTGASGGSAVMPAKGVTVFGSIYAPLGEVRTNGQSFTIRQGRVVALDFLQNGNGGGFSVDTTGDPYSQPSVRLTE